MKDLQFGDYCMIEQKRYGAENEMFVHKVIQRLKSNSWVDVPVQTPAKEVLHGEMEEVVRCITCGVCEIDVRNYRLKDCKKVVNFKSTERGASERLMKAVQKIITMDAGHSTGVKELRVTRKEWDFAYAELSAALSIELSENKPK